MMQRLRDESPDNRDIALANALLSALPVIDESTMRRPNLAWFDSRPRIPRSLPLRLAFAAVILCAGLAAAAVVSITSQTSSPPIAPHVLSPIPAPSPFSADGNRSAPGTLDTANSVASASASSSHAGHAESDSELVLRAVRALRKEQKPQQALALAERYLRLYPRGIQREEVLILAMEATQRMGDFDKARGYAREYLAEYPSGMLAESARRLLRAQ